MWKAAACAAVHRFLERTIRDAPHFTAHPAQIRPVADRPAGRRLGLVSVRTATRPGDGHSCCNRADQQTRNRQQHRRSERIDPARQRNGKRRRGPRPHHAALSVAHRELAHSAAFDRHTGSPHGDTNRHTGSPHGDTNRHTGSPHSDTNRHTGSPHSDAWPARPDGRVAGHHVGPTAARGARDIGPNRERRSVSLSPGWYHFSKPGAAAPAPANWLLSRIYCGHPRRQQSRGAADCRRRPR